MFGEWHAKKLCRTQVKIWHSVERVSELLMLIIIISCDCSLAGPLHCRLQWRQYGVPRH